ncbi:hypothetical protein SRABI106_01259 [Rahnella aquatilis]|nr:hypothetical protein SRABI106_01259 [Rahnella aquatilis]
MFSVTQITPIQPVDCVDSDSAITLGLYCSVSTACITARRLSSLTPRLPLRTRDTAAFDTFASRETSLMFAMSFLVLIETVIFRHRREPFAAFLHRTLLRFQIQLDETIPVFIGIHP